MVNKTIEEKKKASLCAQSSPQSSVHLPVCACVMDGYAHANSMPSVWGQTGVKLQMSSTLYRLQASNSDAASDQQKAAVYSI